MLNRRHLRRGANAIEFALILPVLVGLMGSIVEYGWYFHREVALDGLVQEATRIAVTTPQSAHRTPQQVAEDEIVARLNALGYQGQVDLSIQVNGQSPNEMLDVGVALPHEPLMGVRSYVPTKLVATSAMRLEDQPQ